MKIHKVIMEFSPNQWDAIKTHLAAYNKDCGFKTPITEGEYLKAIVGARLDLPEWK